MATHSAHPDIIKRLRRAEGHVKSIVTMLEQDRDCLEIAQQLQAVEKAIVNSNLGLSPATEGQTIRLRIPELNQDRRKELVKLAHKYAETARIAVRHVRRDAMDLLKKLEKDHKISKDDHERFSGDVQKATDSGISEIDQMLSAKEKEILTV